MLESLPNEIGDLSQLSDLNVSDNHLSFIPESIGQLFKLEILNLSHN